ncbi:MAG TPA: OmpH family outer membrane protein, partial [Verrucomicrobiae bacterium]|nr:OmpH family outer membrane protein [Verrucomicrobiae bacterium]
MKHGLKITILSLVLLGLFSGSAFAQNRIATVNLKKLFDGYWKTKQADAALKDRAAQMDKSHKDMVQTYQQDKADYQKLLTDANDQAISSTEREKRKQAAAAKLKSIKDEENSITQFERQARATLDEQQRRMRANILEEIQNIISAKAKTAGYSLVIDTTAESANNNAQIVLYSNGDNDITADVLKQLNASAPV